MHILHILNTLAANKTNALFIHFSNNSGSTGSQLNRRFCATDWDLLRYERQELGANFATHKQFLARKCIVHAENYI